MPASRIAGTGVGTGILYSLSEATGVDKISNFTSNARDVQTISSYALHIILHEDYSIIIVKCIRLCEEVHGKIILFFLDKIGMIKKILIFC